MHSAIGITKKVLIDEINHFLWYPKSYRRIRAWNWFELKMVWKIWAKTRAIPNGLRFGIATVCVFAFLQSALKMVPLRVFMLLRQALCGTAHKALEKHGQVAPLAIQTPTFGGLCIGCAVLPAQRGHPLRDLPDATIRSENDEDYVLYHKCSYTWQKQLSIIQVLDFIKNVC